MATTRPSSERSTQTLTTATTSQQAPLRKPATAAARGVTLALHAAAGLADSVDRDAARLLRASEGLARAALALLETSARRTAGPPRGAAFPAPGTQPEARPRTAAATGTPPRAAGEQGGGKPGTKVKPKKKNKKKDKGNKDKKGETKDSMDTDGNGEAGETENATATSVPGGEMELDDRWADWKDDSDRTANPLSDAPEAKRRAIAVNLGVPYVGPDFPKGVITPGYKGIPLKAGDDANLVNLVSQPDLNSTPVTLERFESDTNRWTCRLWNHKGGTVCIQPINLHGFLEKNAKEDKARRMVATATKLACLPGGLGSVWDSQESQSAA
jgi:hypothetical protein